MTELEDAAALARRLLGARARVAIEQQAQVTATRRTKLEDGREIVEHDMAYAQICTVGYEDRHEFKVIAQGMTWEAAFRQIPAK